MKKVLVIDDDQTIMEVMKIVLEEEGYTVLVDSKGTYFSKKSNPLPDIILLDLLLKGEDGREICKTIKADTRTSHIPIIIVSAHTSKEVEKAVGEAGADSYLTKPFDIHKLLEKVAQFT